VNSILRRPLRAVGFTIIEILIAIVVLVLGITGIIALFPTAIESGNQTVEDSYAAAITQSVVDAITVGIREARYTYDISGAAGDEWTYFIFNHDGVVDPMPLQPEQYASGVQQTPTPGGYAVPTGASVGPRLYDRDYCILLPRAVQLGASGVGVGALSVVTNNDVTREPFFLYPVPLTPGEEKQRDDFALTNGTVVDNLAVDRQRPQLDGTPIAWIPRVYRLGTYRDPAGTPFTLPLDAGGTPFRPGDIRLEFRSEAVVVEDTAATELYTNYSFAFAMRRARIDSNENGRIDEAGALANQDDFSDSLYLLRIYIFKNFDQSAADQLAPTLNAGMAVPRTNVPVRKFVTLISL
jgi:type II secretory pathway pseudopilin PulG